MDSKDHSEDKRANQREKTLPTYVFGEDYKQTVNLSNKDQAPDNTESVATKKSSSESDSSHHSSNEQNNLLSESVSAELEKLDLEKNKPISMIVNRKKLRIKFLVVIFLLSAMSLGSLYGVSYLLEQGLIGNSKGRHSASGFSVEILTCELAGSSEDLLNIGNALDAKNTVRVDYVNDEFSSIVQTFEARFEDSSTAKIALGKVRSEYVKRFKGAGIATEPFKSDYVQNGESIAVTHQADASNINKDNAVVMYIDVNKNGVVVYDIDSIKNNYEKLGYTCSIE